MFINCPVHGMLSQQPEWTRTDVTFTISPWRPDTSPFPSLWPSLILAPGCCPGVLGDHSRPHTGCGEHHLSSHLPLLLLLVDPGMEQKHKSKHFHTPCGLRPMTLPGAPLPCPPAPTQARVSHVLRPWRAWRGSCLGPEGATHRMSRWRMCTPGQCAESL